MDRPRVLASLAGELRDRALLALLLAAPALVACSGGSSSGDGADAGPGGAECAPFQNTGCSAGEKCSVLIEATEPERLSSTRCVPDGVVPLGGECVSGLASPGADTGFDNCVGATFCLAGTCTEICRRNIEQDMDSCVGKVCSVFAGFFDDVRDDGVAGSEVGLCAPTCDLFDTASCGEGQACYLSLISGKPACASNTEKTPVGQMCLALNQCEAGAGCILQDPVRQLSCALYCNTETELTVSGETCSAALGTQDARCLQVNRFYDNIERVTDDRYGMCVNCGDDDFAGHPLCRADAVFRPAGGLIRRPGRPAAGSA
ncbi:MAG: hypothetical protein MJE77_26675 [Proteobacteria bacterium]|nr:hypothetical protein [Pseudomonadota bacterium]